MRHGTHWLGVFCILEVPLLRLRQHRNFGKAHSSGLDTDFTMRTTHHFWIFLSFLALASCGDPREKELPLNLSTASDARATFEQLTPTEQQAISRYEIRRAARLAQGDETARRAVTYRQAIADEMVSETAEAQQAVAEHALARARQAEEGAKAAAVNIAAQADAHMLSTSITCELRGKSITPVPKANAPLFPMPTASYNLTCRNVSGTVIRGFKGSLFITGPFDELVAGLPIRRDELLAPGGTIDEKISQPFMTMGDGMSGQKFHDLPVEKMTVKVQLDSLVQANGKLISKRPF